MMPSQSELIYFLEVSQTLNVSRASERLGVSQPTLSLAIRRLEDSVGTALLIRSKTGVQLTRAGQKLARQAGALIRDWERLREDVLRDEEEIRGSYILGAHPSVALFTFSKFIGEALFDLPTKTKVRFGKSLPKISLHSPRRTPR